MEENGAVDKMVSGMADGDFLLIFRSLTTEDLQARKDSLLDQMTTLTSMTVGGKSLTRDLRHLKEQLTAITFVLKERGCPYEGVMITDFSTPPATPPPGTIELL